MPRTWSKTRVGRCRACRRGPCRWVATWPARSSLSSRAIRACAMATVGKSRAVVEIGALRFGGLAAWLAWMALHITVLIGFRNRLAVLSSWIYSYVFFRRGSRLIIGLALVAAREPIAPATAMDAEEPERRARW